MEVTQSSAETSYTVWLNVTGADVPVFEAYVGYFYPTQATIVYSDQHDGEEPSIVVSLSGALRRADGSRGVAKREERYVRRNDWPDWLETVVIHHAPSWWTTAAVA